MRNGSFNNRLFFNKYKIKKLIYQTKLSSIYEGINIKNNEPVALKLEKKSAKLDLLESEAYFLFHLKGYGIPKIITYGKSGLFKVLVQELLGLSLNSLWELKKRYKIGSKLLIKDICMIALQALERLEYIHSKNIIHRDIKPNNFLIGKNNPEVIYLIDFGFARKYRSSRTGKHIKFKWIKYAYGSLRYYSINANRGYELSRRDDLESFGYMLVFLAKQYLPWISTEALQINQNIKVEAIYKLRKSATPESLCKGLPEEFAEFIRYSRNLEFEEEPKYDYLKSLFTNILIKNQQKIDFNFFWIVKKDKSKKRKGIKNEDEKNKEKRGNSRTRLFNRIKFSLEKAKSQNILPTLNIKNTENKSTDKPSENKSEKKNENNVGIYNINSTKENINNINEKLKNNYNCKKIDLNENVHCKKINVNMPIKDRIEEYEINLKNSIDGKSYNDKNKTEIFKKKILISPAKEGKLIGKLSKKINKSPITSCITKRSKLKEIKIMRYKTIKERGILNSYNNIYDKDENGFNKNDFNEIIFRSLGDYSHNSTKNNRNNGNKVFKSLTKNYLNKNYNGNNIDYISLNSYNKARDNSLVIINNNTNYNLSKSYLIINNKERKGITSPDIYINRGNLFKSQINNSNINKVNSYRNNNQYY